MINKRIKILRKKFKRYKIDGYIIPKNDEFFSEFTDKDRLKTLSNFSGSAGLAIVTKKKNFLFVDGRYTIQAKQQSGNQFKIIEIHKFLPKNIIKNLKLGFDPTLFTKKTLNYNFGNSLQLISIENNLIDEIYLNKTSKRILVCAEGLGRRESLADMLRQSDIQYELVESWKRGDEGA